MRTLKVLFLHSCPHKGGSQTSLRNLITSFPSGAVEPLVCCPPGSAQKSFESVGIPVNSVEGIPTFTNGRTVEMSGLKMWRLARSFSRGYRKTFLETLDSFNPDIVHLNDCNLLGPLKLAKAEGKKVVVHARFTLSESPRWAWSHQTKTLRGYADKIIAIDGSVLRTLGEQPKATVVYNPLAPGDLLPTGSKKNKRGDSFSAENPMIVGFVSLFYPYKGVFELLEAARALQARKDVRFLLAGANGRPPAFYSSFFGWACDLFGVAPDVEKRMRAIISEWKLDNVILSGFVEDVPSFMKSLDVLVFPSRLDAVPRSVYEAGLFGVPSIVAMEHKVEDIVRDGQNGFIIPERSSEALVRALLRLKEDRGSLARLGANAQKQFSEQFAGERSALEVLQVYREVLRAKQN